MHSFGYGLIDDDRLVALVDQKIEYQQKRASLAGREVAEVLAVESQLFEVGRRFAIEAGILALKIVDLALDLPSKRYLLGQRLLLLRFFLLSGRRFG